MMRIGDDGEAGQASGRPGRERPRRGRACAMIPCESANDLQDLRTTSNMKEQDSPSASFVVYL